MKKLYSYSKPYEDELAELQQEEKIMVEEENYEQAARIRDKIALAILHEEHSPKYYGNTEISETLVKILTINPKFVPEMSFSPEFGRNVLETTKIGNTLLLHRILKTNTDNIIDLGNGQRICFTGKEAVLLADDVHLATDYTGISYQQKIYDRQSFNLLPSKKFNTTLTYTHNGNNYLFFSYFTKMINNEYLDEVIGYFIINKNNTLYYKSIDHVSLLRYDLQNRCCDLKISNNTLEITYISPPYRGLGDQEIVFHYVLR